MPIFDSLYLEERPRRQSSVRLIDGAFSACSLSSVCVGQEAGAPVVELVGHMSLMTELIACLQLWNGVVGPTDPQDKLRILGGATVRVLPPAESTRIELHVPGTTLLHSEPVRCQFNLAAKHLAQLPWNLFSLDARISQVLVEPLSWNSSAANASDMFCGNVAEFMSLAFEHSNFQLPTFHSAKVLAEETWEQGSSVCFEELTVMPRASIFGTVRHSSEALELRRLSVERCKIHSNRSDAAGEDWDEALQVDGRPKVLILDYLENRRILNSAELCLGLRPKYESWLFREPEEHGFCPHARAVHWADIIVMRTGAHVEYASIAGRRGTVLIVVYAYPLLLQRVDVLRALWHSQQHLLDMVLTAHGPIDEHWPPTAMGRLTTESASLCSQADFATILYFPQCQTYFSFNDTSVVFEALAPFISEAYHRITSQLRPSLFDNSCGQSELLRYLTTTPRTEACCRTIKKPGVLLLNGTVSDRRIVVAQA